MYTDCNSVVSSAACAEVLAPPIADLAYELNHKPGLSTKPLFCQVIVEVLPLPSQVKRNMVIQSLSRLLSPRTECSKANASCLEEVLTSTGPLD